MKRAILLISLLTCLHLLLILYSCGTTEYKLEVDLIYINHSDSLINYSELFQLSPGATNAENTIASTLSKKPEINNCCQGILEDFQGSSMQVYLLLNEGEDCVTYAENEGPTSIINFDKKKLSDTHFQYTFSFDNADFKNATKCN